jgi:hypothetical protein
MATVMSMEWPGVAPEQYEQVMTILDLDANPPDGGVFHVSGFTGGSLRVLDVWESEQAWDRFLNERIMPAVEQAGIETQPQVEVYPAHNVYTPSIEELRRIGASSLPTAAA